MSTSILDEIKREMMSSIRYMFPQPVPPHMQVQVIRVYLMGVMDQYKRHVESLRENTELQQAAAMRLGELLIELLPTTDINWEPDDSWKWWMEPFDARNN